MRKIAFVLFLFLMGITTGVAIAQSPSSKNDTTQITIKLPVYQWDIILGALNELPAKTANPIINLITLQAYQQLRPPISDSLNKKPVQKDKPKQ